VTGWRCLERRAGPDRDRSSPARASALYGASPSPVHRRHASREGQPVLIGPSVPSRAGHRRHAAHPHRVVGLRQNRTGPTGRRPGSSRCGSPPATSVVTSCWTSSAARWSRCATRPPTRPRGRPGGGAVARAGRPQRAHPGLGSRRVPRLPRRSGAAAPDGADVGDGGGDVVSSAPELARLTLNVARSTTMQLRGRAPRLRRAHDRPCTFASRPRLARLVTVVGWHSCDHLGPVGRGHAAQRLTIEAVERWPADHSSSCTGQVTGRDAQDVLDWRFLAIAV